MNPLVPKPIDWTRIDKITNAYWHNTLIQSLKKQKEAVSRMSSISITTPRTSTVDAFMKSGYADLVITTLGAEVREYIKQLEARIGRMTEVMKGSSPQTFRGGTAESWANKYDTLERKHRDYWDMNARSHGYYRWTGQAMEWIGNLEDHVRVTHLGSTLRNRIDQAIDALKAARDLTPWQP